MSRNDEYHPVLVHLGLIATKNKKIPDDAPPTALEVLHHLLETNVVKPSAVKSVWQALKKVPSEPRSNKTKEAVVSAARPPSTEEAGNKTTKPGKAATEKQESGAAPYRTRHVALRFYYDGASFSGLAQNIGQENDQSVEKALFAALLKTKLVTSRDTTGYSRCGRTDRGVSAAGQVVALHLKSAISLQATMDQDGQSPISNDNLPKNALDTITVWTPPRKGNGSKIQKEIAEYPYAKMLNNVLPDTIRILGWCPVSSDFSARFSATTRKYRYFFVRRHLDLDKMDQALQLLVGRHDFRNFCKMDVEKVYNFERHIHSAQLVIPTRLGSHQNEEDAVCYIEILGQAFLWHQIRCIASVLFLVGRGLESPSVVKELLNVKEHPGKPSYPLAPERPLVLHHCGYPNLGIGYTVQNLWAVSCHLEQQWEELTLAAARVRNCVQSLRDAMVTRQNVSSFLKTKLQERLKKQQKHNPNNGSTQENLQEMDDGPTQVTGSMLTWRHALDWMEMWNCRPDPCGAKEIAHIPLLQRSRGTTYEEKILALSKSQKRQQKYEENVVKKRKTAEEDAAFYEHMTRQGGTGV